MRTTVALLCALALICPVSAAADSADAQAQALLAKHKAYVGWQFGDGTFRTMRITGAVTDDKGKQDTAFAFLYDGLLFHNTYTDLKRGGSKEYVGFTGNLFWQTNANGFTVPIYGDYAKFLASETVLINEGTTELPGTYRGTKTVDGKAAGVVRVALTNGDTIDLYVDPDTGAYVQATIDPDGAYETTFHIRSYQDVVPGKKMMATYTEDDDSSVHAFTKFEPNLAVANDDLHPPPQVASWTFGDGSPFPFTMTHTRMAVDATVNGVKGKFILDTGADGIYLDDRFASRANLPSVASDSAYMIYGEVKTRLRKAQTIAIGNATLHDALVYSQDFGNGEDGDVRSEGYDGLLGYDVFAGTVVRLNVYGSTMAILDPNTDLSGEKGLAVTVDLSQGSPIVPMTLNKSIPVSAMLDTGSPGLIFFGPDLMKKYHFATFNGCANIDTLAIGPIVYTDESACQYGLSAAYMLLGFDFLRHFDFVFDYPHGRMFMTPNQNKN